MVIGTLPLGRNRGDTALIKPCMPLNLTDQPKLQMKRDSLQNTLYSLRAVRSKILFRFGADGFGTKMDESTVLNSNFAGTRIHELYKEADGLVKEIKELESGQ